MTAPMPGKALVVPRYCDFGHCAPSCRRRCESWMAMAWRAWHAQRRQPAQRDLFRENAA